MPVPVMIFPTSLGSIRDPIQGDGIGGMELGELKLTLGSSAGKNELTRSIFLNPPRRSRGNRVSDVSLGRGSRY